MKTLIHVCCTPCLIAPLRALRDDKIEVSGFFYNPNIHPFLEFRKRIKALRVFLEGDDVPMDIDEEYGLEKFVREIYHPQKHRRCFNCYSARMEQTARRARESGIETFTTTLLVSPHQNHDLVREAAERASEKTGVAFLYRDFRPLHELSHREAKRKMLYLQQYCGCCFSEYERYRDTTRELYRGPGGAAR